MTLRWLVCILSVLCLLLLSTAAPGRAAPTCMLHWEPVTTTIDGATVPAFEIAYRLYVGPIAQPFVPGEYRAETTQTTIACEAVGFVSGTQAAATTVHTPSGTESAFSNVLIRLVLTSPANLHIEYQ